MIGKTILHYKILEKLGEGGMGVVYKAEDTKLERTVALKFLSLTSIGDEEKKRFKREAKAAASLNHPNIATIFAIEEADDQTFIVMEFIEGKSVEDIVGAQHAVPLPLDDAVNYATQMAAGLQAAHKKGITHRDIKSANIMITEDGQVKIMDFGLAKLANRSKMTQLGTTLGTVAYMSPEQSRGEEADHRSDIWSLGVVLYEMISGQMPFKGDYEQAVIYSIQNEDPEPLTALRTGVPIALDGIIAKALAKDASTRYQNVEELPADLRGLESSAFAVSRIGTTAPSTAAAGKAGQKTDRFGWPMVAVAAVAGGALAVLLMMFLNQTPSAPRSVVRSSFDIPARSRPTFFWEQMLALSRDGTSIAYTGVSNGELQIFLRKIDQFISTPVRGTRGGSDPFISGDGNWLGFAPSLNAEEQAARVPIEGGAPEISSEEFGLGTSWGEDGFIVSIGTWGRGLSYQTAWKGERQELTKVDGSKNEGAHLYPDLLPGNKAVFFTIWNQEGTYDDSRIGLVEVSTKKRKVLSYGGSELRGTTARFLETPWGDYVVWAKSGNLLAAAFDVEKLEVTEPPVKIVDGVMTNGSSGAAAFAVSSGNNGTLIFVPGTLESEQTMLTWRTEDGRETPALKNPGPYIDPTFSADGKLAITLMTANYDIAMVDLAAGSVKLFHAKKDNDYPIFTPDGSQVTFASNFETGRYDIYQKPTDSIGPARRLVETETDLIPRTSSWSPDGRFLVFDFGGNNSPKYGNDLWVLDTQAGRGVKPLFETEAAEKNGKFSPDGKILAYQSNEVEGEYEVFVRPFPITEESVQVSSGGGGFPVWSPNSKKLYYRKGENIMVANIESNPNLHITKRAVLFKSPQQVSEIAMDDFAVAPDGRFLLVRSAVDLSKPLQMNVVTNWFEELKHKVAGGKP